MTINLYNFSKRQNSTAQPSGSGTAVTCTLKENCSLFNPVFQLAASYATAEKNYVKWGTRYYFVKDIVYETNSLASLYCEEDVLASWKNAIGTSTQYVLRSASSYDGTIIDNLYPAKTNATPLGMFLSDMQTPTMTEGYYVIGFLLGSNNSATPFAGGIRRGSVTYFVFSVAQTNALISQLSDQSLVFNKLKAPFEYITSCIYIPFKMGTESTESSIISLGSEYTFTIAHCSLTNVTDGIYQSAVYSDSIPGHTQSYDRGEYLCHSPYMSMTLYAGPFGVQTIDTNTMYFNADTEDEEYYAPFYYRYSVDLPTGIGRFEWSQHDQYPDSPTMARDTEIYISNVGVSVNLTAMTWGNFKDVLAAGSSLVSAFGSTASAAASGGSPINGSTFAAIGDVCNVMSDHIYSKGATGTMIEVYKPCVLIVERAVADEDNEDRGRPLCKKKTINTLSGYILVADADLAFAGNAQELATAKQFLESGFFYE